MAKNRGHPCLKIGRNFISTKSVLLNFLFSAPGKIRNVPDYLIMSSFRLQLWTHRPSMSASKRSTFSSWPTPSSGRSSLLLTDSCTTLQGKPFRRFTTEECTCRYCTNRTNALGHLCFSHTPRHTSARCFERPRKSPSCGSPSRRR